MMKKVSLIMLLFPFVATAQITTHWTQSEPFNLFCPVDPLTTPFQRSYAGCPAVAMGQIVNAVRSTNGTRLGEADRYYHAYPGRYFYIDDDSTAYGFPSFHTLNYYLCRIDSLFALNQDLEDKDAAALVFSCGVLCRQWYTADVSGTATVDQAYDAYRRMGFDRCRLLRVVDSAMFALLDDNLAHGYPAHLAVESPDGQSGHNVVVDAKRESDGKYHVNFGFGGENDGWYSIPDPDFPYGLTKLEGIIVDIIPSDTLGINAFVTESKTQRLHLSPNPAHGTVSLSGVGLGRVEIFNIKGVKVLEEQTDGIIDIGTLVPGVYIVRMHNETARLVVTSY